MKERAAASPHVTMANPVRLLRLWLSVILILGIITPVAGDDDDNDIRDPLEAAGITCDHGICRDVQDIVKHAPQYTDCEDLREKCEVWGAEGLCESNSKYMHPHCPRTCYTCHNRTLLVPRSHAFSLPAKILNSKKPIVSVAGANLGVPQNLHVMPDSVLEVVQEARDYVENTVMVEPRYESVRTLCRNQNQDCALWAAQGECEENPPFMRENCAPVCFSCEDLHVDAKCPLDPNAKNAWYPGDLNRMFERMTTDPAFQQYTPTVMSRPDLIGDDTEETADYQLGPWVLVLEDFVSADEAERMIQAGAEIGYARSTDVGEVNEDGSFEDVVSTSRTSMNAWCNEESCQEDPMVKDVVNRIETLTQIPLENSEALQLLRYEDGQFYKTHHDYIDQEKDRAQGVRILTVFLYLSDVEEGGGTNFPSLDLTVEPKRGRALLWPSVLDEDPHDFDPRTYHQAYLSYKG
jgi:prolyl 4-hydroxylase